MCWVMYDWEFLTQVTERGDMNAGSPDLDPKWGELTRVKLTPNGKIPGIFSDQIQYILSQNEITIFSH